MNDIIKHHLVTIPAAARSLLGVSNWLDDIVCDCYMMQEITKENIVLVAWARERTGYVVQYNSCPHWANIIPRYNIPMTTARILLLKDANSDALPYTWNDWYGLAHKALVHHTVMKRLLVAGYRFGVYDVVYNFTTLTYTDIMPNTMLLRSIYDGISDENIIRTFEALIDLDWSPNKSDIGKFSQDLLDTVKNQVDNLAPGRHRNVLSAVINKIISL